MLHQRVGNCLRPAHEVVYALLRTIGIVDFQAESLLAQVIADGTQAVAGPLRYQGRWFLIAIDALSHEIIGAIVANLQNGIGHGIGEHHELTGVVGSTYCITIAAQEISSHQSAAEKDQQGCRKSLFIHFLRV